MKCFLKSPKDHMRQDAMGLKTLRNMVYFMGVPIEDKANKVNLEHEVHNLVLQKIYLKTLRIFVYFMGMPIVSEANKVIDK